MHTDTGEWKFVQPFQQNNQNSSSFQVGDLSVGKTYSHAESNYFVPSSPQPFVTTRNPPSLLPYVRHFLTRPSDSLLSRGITQHYYRFTCQNELPHMIKDYRPTQHTQNLNSIAASRLLLEVKPHFPQCCSGWSAQTSTFRIDAAKL